MKIKMMTLALAAVALLGVSCTTEQKSNDEGTATSSEMIAVQEMEDLTSELYDHGTEPLVIDIEALTKQNETFRTTIWTGENLQLTVMSIPVGGEIGLEIHKTVEQFIRIEEGDGLMMMGDTEDNLPLQVPVSDDDVVLVPVGKWHNIKNTGDEPLKLYSIYALPEHEHGTVHQTFEESEAAHHHHD